MTKRVLLIGNGNHQLNYHFVNWFINQYGDEYVFDLFNTNNTISEEYSRIYDNIYFSRTSSFLGRIRLLKRLYVVLMLNINFNRISDHYHIIHINFAWLKLAYLLNLRKKAKYVIVSIWGSDFYRKSSRQKKTLSKLLNRSDLINCTNEKTLLLIKSYFKLPEKKMNSIRIGLEPLERLKGLKLTKAGCKDYLTIPADKKLITIGYNARPEQEHLKIIELIKQNREKFDNKQDLFFLFPLTYGGTKQYLNKVKVALNGFPFEYKLITGFLSDNEIAIVRKATDIFVQLQPTDQLSGSMQEHMYAGSIVITGSWLPYQIFKEMGIHFRTIDNFAELVPELGQCIENMELELRKTEPNREKIYEFSGWGTLIKEWKSLYDSLN